MTISEDAPVLRIGELSRRAGVSGHVLRAWERRYGLLQPVRTEGGFRLYTAADERRVRRMRKHLARGLSAAEAAQATLQDDASGREGPPSLLPAAASGLAGMLREALDAFDEPTVQAVLDRLLSDLSVTVVMREIVLPYLAELGDRCERGDASIAQEHFASNLIRGRLAGLARGWGDGSGPRAILACPPGEQHDLALMIFGVALNRHGWRIDYLGVDTPIEELTRTAAARLPDLVVLAATQPGMLEPLAAELATLADTVPLALAGAGAAAQLAAAVGARRLNTDPVTAAETIGRPR
ncbi:MAG TPA: cobalamin B12-binding domain-containing protein [Streptosporangiaceae bacterium]|nr:cobalamin B12-binding domain-containing protein [Streptosporangiaceae bacterium]